MTNFERPLNTEQQIRQTAWDAKILEVRQRKDKVDGEMDEGIVDMVAALNLNGIPTEASCEGHLDHGYPTPWIDIEAENRPAVRYNNEKQIYKSILDKYGITREQLGDPEGERVWLEICAKLEAAGETDEYKNWLAENLRYRAQVEALVQEYYDTKGEGVAGLISFDEFGGGAFRIHTGGSDYEYHDWDNEKRTPEESRQLEERLPIHRQAMDSFMLFLKEKFLQGK